MNAWKCELCGYVHQGSTAPDSCVICSASKEHFSALELVTAPAKTATTNKWRCSICDHIEIGRQPPKHCPICSATANLFEAFADEESACCDATIKQILIIGAGIAGLTAAEEARKCTKSARIVLINKEPSNPYFRLNLTRYLAGEISEQELPIQTEQWFNEQNIELILGETQEIDRQLRQVKLRDGRIFSYDRLVLSNGSHSFVPPIPGTTREGVQVLRTLQDAQSILERLQPGLRCICIGGGLLGLETAAALARRGTQVTVLEGNPWLMARQLPQLAGELLLQQLENMGIKVRCGVKIDELTGDEHLRGVLLNNGEELSADLVIFSAGVRPNSWLARQAKLKVGGGIVVDDRMTTSDPAILAAGDIAEHRGKLYGIWPASFTQGVVAGINACGGNAKFPGMSLATRIKVLSIDLFSIGQLNLDDASYRLIERCSDGNYCGLVCHDNKIVGAALFGNTELAGEIKKAIENAVQLPELPKLLELFPELAS